MLRSSLLNKFDAKNQGGLQLSSSPCIIPQVINNRLYKRINLFVIN